MASVIRPGLLKQSSILAAPSKQVFSRLPLSSPLRSSTIIINSRQSPFTRSHNATSIAQVAAFHASARKQILPPGPQVIKGTMNDPAPVPKPNPVHGAYHWTFERAISVGILPLTAAAPFIGGTLNPTLDAVFIAFILIHSHIGFQ